MTSTEILNELKKLDLSFVSTVRLQPETLTTNINSECIDVRMYPELNEKSRGIERISIREHNTPNTSFYMSFYGNGVSVVSTGGHTYVRYDELDKLSNMSEDEKFNYQISEDSFVIFAQSVCQVIIDNLNQYK